MTLQVAPHPNVGFFMSADNPESRAVLHARLLRGWMDDRGLKAPSLALSVERQGQQISPDYIRKLTRGERELASMPLELREAVRRALRVASNDWEAATGLATAADIDPDPLALVAKQPTSLDLPDTLRGFIDEYGRKFKELLEPRWQRWLANTDFREEPETPEDWLAVFLYFREKVNPR
jgi:hypothetical protein